MLDSKIQIVYIWTILYENRKEYVLLELIKTELDKLYNDERKIFPNLKFESNKINPTVTEINRAINYLLDNNYLDTINSIDADGAELPFLKYSLTYEGVKHFEKSMLKTKKAENGFNLNNFNEDCFLLFNFLIENYTKAGNIKYINIYYFLKYLSKENKDTYQFKMSIKNEYKPYILKRFNISITKFQTALEYETSELPKLKNLETIFKNNLNK